MKKYRFLLSKFTLYERSISYNNKRSKAFTLAEVLIALVIIGIVSALTLPSLISKICKSCVSEINLKQKTALFSGK